MFLSARLRAERLRSLYFEHVALAACAEDEVDGADVRLRDLERRVAEVHYGKVSS